MDYATLVTQIRSFTEVDNTGDTPVTLTDTVVNQLIALAEARIYRDVDLHVTRKYVTTTFTGSSAFINKPAASYVVRWVEVLDAAGNRTLLLEKDTSFLIEFWPNRTRTGVPRFWSPWDDTQLYIAPTPPSALSAEIAYTYRPTGLSSTNTTTWLSLNAEAAMLNACLVEASVFLKQTGDPAQGAMFPAYMQRYKEAITALDAEEKLKGTDGARSGQ